MPILALSVVMLSVILAFVAVVLRDVRSFATLTVSCMLTVPVPAARSSKGVFDVVVVTTLSFTKISSNCALAPTLIFCPISASLLIVKLPV